MAFDATKLFIQPGAGYSGDSFFRYESDVDNLATIVASGYFNSATNNFNQYTTIEIRGTDGKELVYVNSASQAATVTVAAFSHPVTLSTGQVTSDHILDGTIVNVDISASAAIDYSKMASMTGDASMTANALTISGGAVDAGKLASDAVTSIKIQNNAVSADKLGTDSVTTVKIADGNVTAIKLASDSVTNAKMADNAVGGAELNTHAVDDLAASAQIMVVFDLTGGAATANEDKTLTHKMTITGFEVVNKQNGSPGDTIQLKTGGDASISDAVSVGGVNNTVQRNNELYTANAVIAAAGTLRIHAVDGGGNDRPNVRVQVYGFKTA